MRVTALLMARDFKSPKQASDLFLQQIVRLRGLESSDFERFRWIYRPSDFSRFQSVIYNLLNNLNESSRDALPSGISFESLGGRIPVKNIWTRFEAAVATFTRRQKKAVDLLYMQDERPTLKAAADKLNISVASLRDRVAGAAKKLRDAFPEFANLKPSRSRTSLKNRPLIYDGLFRRESSKIRRTVTRIKTVGHLELRELLPTSPNQVIAKREPDPIIKKWLEDYKLKERFVSHLDEPNDRSYEDHKPRQRFSENEDFQAYDRHRDRVHHEEKNESLRYSAAYDHEDKEYYNEPGLDYTSELDEVFK